jgi:selenocysteine lyase/cysteine desulfurase
MVQADVWVPCADGRTRRHVNLDYAASTPPMAGVLAIVQDFTTWYGSGDESDLGAAAYEAAGGAVAEFVGARDGAVVLVRDAATAIDVLAAALPGGTRVVSALEDETLRWPHPEPAVLPAGAGAAELVERCEHALRAARSRIDLLAVTGASGVTGEVRPLAEPAAVAHHYGAKLFVDATQLAPHRAIDMAATGIDYLALSGETLYAPFGSGALVVCARGLAHEGAGPRNVVGAVALGAACRTLGEVGMECLAARERGLLARLSAGLAGVPGLQQPLQCADRTVERIGLALFNLEGYRPPAAGLDPRRRARDRRPARRHRRRAGEPRSRDHGAGRRPAGRRPGRDRLHRLAPGRPPRRRAPRVPARAPAEPSLRAGARERVGAPAQVVEGRRRRAARDGDLAGDLRDRGHHLRAADAAVVAAEAAAPTGQHPPHARAAHRVGQPCRRHLALAAGEASDPGDVGA